MLEDELKTTAGKLAAEIARMEQATASPGLAKVGLTAQPCEAAAGTVRIEGGTVFVATTDEWLSVRVVNVGEAYVDAAQVLGAG